MHKKKLYNFCEKRHIHQDGINTYALGLKNTFKKMINKKLIII